MRAQDPPTSRPRSACIIMLVCLNMKLDPRQAWIAFGMAVLCSSCAIVYAVWQNRKTKPTVNTYDYPVPTRPVTRRPAAPAAPAAAPIAPAAAPSPPSSLSSLMVAYPADWVWDPTGDPYWRDRTWRDPYWREKYWRDRLWREKFGGEDGWHERRKRSS